MSPNLYAITLKLKCVTPWLGHNQRWEMTRKSQNCKVEMTRCTINSKNLCIFALRGTCFPSKFSVSAVFLVIKGSHTDLHRFDPHRPYSIKTRIKTAISAILASTSAFSHRPYSIKTRIKTSPSLSSVARSAMSRRPYSIKTRIKTRPYGRPAGILQSPRRPYSIKTRIKTKRETR